MNFSPFEISEILPNKLYLSGELGATNYQALDYYNIHTLLRLDKDALFRPSWGNIDLRRNMTTIHFIDGLGNEENKFLEAVKQGRIRFFSRVFVSKSR